MMFRSAKTVERPSDLSLCNSVNNSLYLRDCLLLMAKRGPVFTSKKDTVKNAPLNIAFLQITN